MKGNFITFHKLIGIL